MRWESKSVGHVTHQARLRPPSTAHPGSKGKVTGVRRVGYRTNVRAHTRASECSSVGPSLPWEIATIRLLEDQFMHRPSGH